MYKCPNGCTHDAPSFYREVLVAVREDISPSSGDALNRYKSVDRDRGPVRCCECDSRAEWIETRQLEMFEVQPTLA